MVTWSGINKAGMQLTQWHLQNKGRSGWTGTRSFSFKVVLCILSPSIINYVACDWIVQRPISKHDMAAVSCECEIFNLKAKVASDIFCLYVCYSFLGYVRRDLWRLLHRRHCNWRRVHCRWYLSRYISNYATVIYQMKLVVLPFLSLPKMRIFRQTCNVSER